jgi:putative transcriptional regulator
MVAVAKITKRRCRADPDRRGCGTLERRTAKAHDRRMELAGKILIAMPGMGDPRFSRAVVLICAHSDDGAMGLIVNKPTPDLKFAILLEQLKIAQIGPGRDIRVHFGGPVERGRGFVLHSPDYHADGGGTIEVGDDYGMTATQDVLAALASGQGPQEAFLALGYAGWGPGQLESEIARNDWLTGEPGKELVFGTEDAGKWALALRRIGIDPVSLSAAAGRA